MNRLELTSNRLEDDLVNFTKLMSKNEDVDIAEAIMNLQNEEYVYRASLSAGAKVIQPSLIDFLR
jgi:flagellar hook-associated protein 3 FlgL